MLPGPCVEAVSLSPLTLTLTLTLLCFCSFSLRLSAAKLLECNLCSDLRHVVAIKFRDIWAHTLDLAASGMVCLCALKHDG